MAQLHQCMQTLLELDLSKPVQPCTLSVLSQACQQWGFFYITNHGISRDLFSKMCLYSKHLFSLPADSKLKLRLSSSVETYTPPFIASPFFECLRIRGPEFYASAKSSADVLLGQKSSEFSEVLQEYGSKMEELAKKIMEIILLCLGDGYDKLYESDFKNCHGYLRMVNYSPPQDVEEKNEIEGLGMHTDMSCITILYQGEVGGLQVRSKEGEWIDINPCQTSLVVNIGDLMQAWSNGRLRSSEHRVVLKSSANRISLPFFWCFEDEKVIQAPDKLVGDGNSRLYKPFLCSDYIRFRESNKEGKFEKVGYTVKDFAGMKTNHPNETLS